VLRLGIFEIGPYNLSPLALNYKPYDFCLCCGKDYRCETQKPGPFRYIITLMGAKVNMMSRYLKGRVVSALQCLLFYENSFATSMAARIVA
jgi:hypothetical protein